MIGMESTYQQRPSCSCLRVPPHMPRLKRNRCNPSEPYRYRSEERNVQGLTFVVVLLRKRTIRGENKLFSAGSTST